MGSVVNHITFQKEYTMRLGDFDAKFKGIRQADTITLTCDDPRHEGGEVTLKMVSARRNILKHDSEEFVCGQCDKRYNNGMNRVGKGRNSLGVISVECPCCGKSRDMDAACYYGSLKPPYKQVCGSCAQEGKEIPQAQREKIRESLTGRELTPDHKAAISRYAKNNPEGIARAKANLVPGFSSGWNKGISPSPEARRKQSETMTGRVYTPEHRENISVGRKAMLKETGGFTPEHREKLRVATVRRYQEGFNPNKNHRQGWHISPKAGKVYHRSSYEKRAFEVLDADDSIRTYEVERLTLPYDNPVKQAESTYMVDIRGSTVDGEKFVIEIKPKKQQKDPVVVAKQQKLAKWAAENDAVHMVWGMEDFFENEKEARAYADKLKADLEGVDFTEMRQEAWRERTKRHYHNKIKGDRVDVTCECGNCNGQKVHNVLRVAYEENLRRNGYYYSKDCSDKRSKPNKNKNPLEAEGKKKCSGECKRVLLLESFSVNNKQTGQRCSQCRECRAKVATAKYQAKKKVQ